MEATKNKRPGGRPAHQPTDKDRQMAEVLAGFAIPTAKIADVIGIDQKTLFKHYGDAIRRDPTRPRPRSIQSCSHHVLLVVDHFGVDVPCHA